MVISNSVISRHRKSNAVTIAFICHERWCGRVNTGAVVVPTGWGRTPLSGESLLPSADQLKDLPHVGTRPFFFCIRLATARHLSLVYFSLLSLLASFILIDDDSLTNRATKIWFRTPI
jgi:hypothetical protein